MNTESICNYFIEEGYITGIISKIKSGKEADIYLCESAGRIKTDFLCVKAYKDFNYRSFQNDSVYHTGRFNKKTRDGRAFINKTNFGRELRHDLWLQNEYSALIKLNNVGVKVPKAFACSSNGILIEYLGDNKQAASQLKDVVFNNKYEAKKVFETIINQTEKMLLAETVHGDLSAYNILYWKNVPYIIDFPQSVNPGINNEAINLFIRDICNITKFLLNLIETGTAIPAKVVQN